MEYRSSEASANASENQAKKYSRFGWRIERQHSKPPCSDTSSELEPYVSNITIGNKELYKRKAYQEQPVAKVNELVLDDRMLGKEVRIVVLDDDRQRLYKLLTSKATSVTGLVERIKQDAEDERISRVLTYSRMSMRRGPVEYTYPPVFVHIYRPKLQKQYQPPSVRSDDRILDSDVTEDENDKRRNLVPPFDESEDALQTKSADSTQPAQQYPTDKEEGNPEKEGPGKEREKKKRLIERFYGPRKRSEDRKRNNGDSTAKHVNYLTVSDRKRKGKKESKNKPSSVKFVDRMSPVRMPVNEETRYRQSAVRRISQTTPLERSVPNNTPVDDKQPYQRTRERLWWGA